MLPIIHCLQYANPIASLYGIDLRCTETLKKKLKFLNFKISLIDKFAVMYTYDLGHRASVDTKQETVRRLIMAHKANISVYPQQAECYNKIFFLVPLRNSFLNESHLRTLHVFGACSSRETH